MIRSSTLLAVALISCLSANKLFAESYNVVANTRRDPVQGMKTERGLDYVPSNKEKSESIKELEFLVLDLDYPIIDLYTSTKSQDELLIDISSDILFDFDKSSLKPSAFPSLRIASKQITEMARGDVRIEGHTDSKGTDAYNQSLSEARAKSVRKWLLENGGLTDINFVVRGFGETKPIEPNETNKGEDNPAGRQRNRRVEIIVNTSE
tara:strand:- start:890 stop:1513 length:624 start_codon:yes stop_codon:yes gene_type:complete